MPILWSNYSCFGGIYFRGVLGHVAEGEFLRHFGGIWILRRTGSFLKDTVRVCGFVVLGVDVWKCS